MRYLTLHYSPNRLSFLLSWKRSRDVWAERIKESAVYLFSRRPSARHLIASEIRCDLTDAAKIASMDSALYDEHIVLVTGQDHFWFRS